MSSSGSASSRGRTSRWVGEIITNLKEEAAKAAVAQVKSGMVVGLGSGSTASIAIKLLGEQVRHGMEVVGVPTSRDSEILGRSVGIQIGELKDHPVIDVTIDGADEVDPKLNLVKGLGGALVREKIVASATKLEIIVVDDSKLVDFICQKAPLPVEIIRFAHESTMSRLEKLGCRPALRKRGGEAIVTDNGNFIADCKFSRIDDPAAMEREINNLPGVVDNGLFVGLAHKVIVASKGGMRTMQKS
ncbi:MAG: ribose-5-phosphate isomerase RpiA [Candidatus Thermoplasmatota archaeon]|nr:ribose-5-phosphate isomerase RpiA [Candidatus Thermoplasmatota archaeon]